MALTIWARPYYNDSDLTDTTIKQEVVWTDKSPILKAVKVSLLLYNNPTFTSLNMKIYNSNLGLLHTSASRLSADLIDDTYTLVETYFEFANVNLVKDESYYFVLNAVGYTGASATKHIAWQSSYPDPFYSSGSANTRVELAKYPLRIFTISARFDEP